MSTTTVPDQVKHSRWLDWKTKPQISGDSAESEPPKPTEPGIGGFGGSTPVQSPEIELEPHPAKLAQARSRLNQAGVRKMQIDAASVIGVWSDLDGPEIRAALRILGLDAMPVRYLDGLGIPMHYKFRQVDGEPVPMCVLVEMERNPADPWSVRDRMLKEMAWCPKRVSWAEWKAATLNRIFRELGVTGQPGRIEESVMA